MKYILGYSKDTTTFCANSYDLLEEALDQGEALLKRQDNQYKEIFIFEITPFRKLVKEIQTIITEEPV